MADVCFRDMTDATARKVSREKAKRTARTTRNRQYDDLAAPGCSDMDQSCSIQPLRTVVTIHSLHTPLEDVATNYMHSCYSPTTSFFYLTTAPGIHTVSELLPSCVLLAPALALLSQETRQSAMLERARQEYVNAVAATNLALSSPNSAKADTTLLAVLLLSLYEATVFRGRESPTGWTAHTSGATALLALRGGEQLHTHLGRLLYMHASSCIRASCLQRHVAVPPVLVKLQGLMPRDADESKDPGFQFAFVLDEMAQLMHQFWQGHGWGSRDFIRSVVKLEDKAAALMANLHDIWPYEVIEDRTQSEKSKKITHRYSSERPARHWNSVRMIRLLLNSCVFYLESNLHDSLHDTEVDRTTRKNASLAMESLAWDIIASVPYFLDESAHRSVIATAQCVIYPLSIVASCRFVTSCAVDAARNWLQYLSLNLGISQATEALKMSREKPVIEDWLHLCYA